MVIIELDSCGIPSYGVFEMGGYRGWVHGPIGSTATLEEEI